VIEWLPPGFWSGYYADAALRAIMKTDLSAHPDWLLLVRAPPAKLCCVLRRRSQNRPHCCAPEPIFVVCSSA
jgi:hypothetical protein